jgi:capsular polysaccharide biosynthesis protein
MRAPTRVPRARDYVHILANGWIVLVSATLLSGLAGWLAWQTAQPVYAASLRAFAVAPGGGMPQDAYYGHLSAVYRSESFRELAHSSQLLNRVIDEVGLNIDTDELADEITVNVDKSALVEVVVTGHDREETRRTAEAISRAMTELSREMEITDRAGVYLVSIDADTAPVRQGSLRDYILQAVAIGLAIAVVLVLAHGLLSDSVLGSGHMDEILRQSGAGEVGR